MIAKCFSITKDMFTLDHSRHQRCSHDTKKYIPGWREGSLLWLKKSKNNDISITGLFFARFLAARYSTFH